MNSTGSQPANEALSGGVAASQSDTLQMSTRAASEPITGLPLQAAGAYLLRYGLALVLIWIGCMKFTAYEANGIRPLVANSPLMSWMYGVFSVREFSDGLGALEVTLGALIALRTWLPRASAAAAGMAVVMFLTTLSFLFTTPGWEPSLGGFPALSASVGQFLLKDVVLLGAALWCWGESYSAGQVADCR